MIELKNISVKYGGNIAVNQVSATANTGQVIALVGPNGSGKSSLIKAIAGVLPHEGTTSLPSDPKHRARQIAYLPQNAEAPAHRVVEDIITLGRTPYLGLLSKLNEADRRAVKQAAKACETDIFFGRKFGTLSGGEKMRVHLSRALTTQAPLLLADEPTTGLDPYYQITAMNILRQTADENMTVIVALHDLKLAEKFADKIWVMQAGKLIATGSAQTALSKDILKSVFRITPDGQAI